MRKLKYLMCWLDILPQSSCFPLRSQKRKMGYFYSRVYVDLSAFRSHQRNSDVFFSCVSWAKFPFLCIHTHTYNLLQTATCLPSFWLEQSIYGRRTALANDSSEGRIKAEWHLGWPRFHCESIVRTVNWLSSIIKCLSKSNKEQFEYMQVGKFGYAVIHIIYSVYSTTLQLSETKSEWWKQHLFQSFCGYSWTLTAVPGCLPCWHPAQWEKPIKNRKSE